MLLRQLRLSGFKSFVEPSTLRIEPGLTGVVGPNGCGKSNLLEAIRWVMGENSPKSMRSGGMDDVIFAGTASRPPRDFAEVVLSGKDSEGDDFEVVRRIERGAGSAYRVNGKDVRAKDVALTFADAATGAHSPALVSQGKIAQVIAAKPVERRQMLEEAAGISGLHVRRRDAESKLRQTEANLARLEDLMTGLDSQIASLRRQAKQAERYARLSDEIKTAEARLVFVKWRDAASAAEEAKRAAALAEEEVANLQSTVNDAQTAQRTSAEKLAEARDELADRRDDANAHGHRMASLTAQLEAAEERLADLDRQKQRLEEDRSDADRLTRDAADALKTLETALAEAEKDLAQEEQRQPSLEAQAEDAERQSRAAELALAKAAADNAGVEAEWRVLDAELSQIGARVLRIETDRQRVDAQLDTLAAENSRSALGAAKAAREQAERRLTECRGELEASRSRKAELQTARDRTSADMAAARADLAGVDREFNALKQDREARRKASEKRAGRKQAIDGLRAKKGYERAVAAALGRDGKAMLGASDEQEGRYWTGADQPAPAEDNLLTQLHECPEELRAFFALVMVAETDDGRPLEPGQSLVTKVGALRRWDGLVVRGEGAADAARLEAENRFAELADLVPDLKAAVERAEHQHSQTDEALGNVQSDLVRQERELSTALDAERQALREFDRAEATVERNAQRKSELADAAQELDRQSEQANGELRAAEAKRATLPDPEKGRLTLEIARTKNDAARAAMQAHVAELSAHKQALAVARERTTAQRSEIANWQARSGEAARRLSGMERRFEEIAEERAIVTAKPEGLVREIEQGDRVRDRLSADLSSAQTRLAEAEKAAREAETALASAGENLAAARENRAGLAARAENQDSRRMEMARISGERFQAPPPLLPERFDFTEGAVGLADRESEELDRLTATRERIGPVNLVAAQELERIETEHGANAAEQEELREAVARLRGSIGSLNREGRERLRDAFEQVDGHFRRLFTRLFEGGQAHLALIDSDDPLEAGLEIFAQPPGKRLQSLTLLSGGEQALTAIALIFALFLTNPAPICVLDEVDAPLDDANIDRFCDLLDQMSRETATRYLIVTHNAVTMSRMHRLFGVTMIEQGISRLVSVDLGGAEELLAAE